MGGTADLHSMAAWEILFTLKQAIEQSAIVPSPLTTASDRRKLRDTLAHLQTMNGVMGTIDRTANRESLKPFVLVRAEHGVWKVIPSGMRGASFPSALTAAFRTREDCCE